MDYLNKQGQKTRLRKRLRREEINALQYKKCWCAYCGKGLDCCRDTVIVSTHGQYCPNCWGIVVKTWWINGGDINYATT